MITPNYVPPKLSTMRAKSRALVACGLSPAQAAKETITEAGVVGALILANSLPAPAQGDPGSEWYAVKVEFRDAAQVAMLLTALAGLTAELELFARARARRLR